MSGFATALLMVAVLGVSCGHGHAAHIYPGSTEGDWPYGPVDALRPWAKPSLRELFDWYSTDGQLCEMGLRRLLNVQWQADGHAGGMPELFFRVYAKGIFLMMSRNETLSWTNFEALFTSSFPWRRHLFNKFLHCNYLRVRKLPQDDCYHYRYEAKTESHLRALGGDKIIDQIDERYRRKRASPKVFLPAPEGGYHDEPEQLSETAPARGCVLAGSSVNCSFGGGRRGPRHPRGRVAVLVTGIKDRFYPRSVFRHVVAPVTRAGYRVDYFALLDWAKTPMVDQVTAEGDVGIFNPVKSQNSRDFDSRSVPNPQVANASMRQVLGLVSRYGRKYGASSLFLRFMPTGLREDPPRVGCNRYLGQGGADILNYRRTRLTYKNIQLLWNVVQEHLVREGLNSRYTHVLWQREDLHWVADLDLSPFADPQSVYGCAMGNRCEPNTTGTAQDGNVADKTLLVGGEAAQSFFRLYDIVNCANRDPGLDRSRDPEHFLFKVILALRLKFQEVAWEKLPTLIARHAKVFGPWGQRSVFCLRFDRKHLVSPDSPCRALDMPYRCCFEAIEGLLDEQGHEPPAG